MNNIAIQSHYSAAQLASMSIPGVPTSKGKAIAKAEREGWAFIEVKGVGGTRREYAPPASVIAAIQQKAAQTLVAAVPALRAPARTIEQLPLIATEDQTLKAECRKGVLLALQTLMNRSGYTMKKAARTLVEMARSGEANPQLVAMLKAARDERGRPSADGLPSDRSVLRFVEYERSGSLVPKKTQRDMRVPDWAPAFMALYQRPEKPTVEHAYREFVKAPGVAEVPSVHQVRRFLGKVGNVTLEMGRMGERELKNIKPFFRRAFDQLLPADIYTADGHTFDAEVQHPMHGRPFRPEITTVIDIATRRAVGWSTGLAESSFEVLDALRNAVFTGGIPAIFYVDNGSGYKNQLMTDVGVGLMSRLGTEMRNSLPYNSQARGVIEKSHQTIWVNAAKKIAGYIGRDMDREAKLNVFKLSRKAIAKPGEAQAMPLMGWNNFVAFAKEQVDEYNNRPHRSLAKIDDPATGRRRHMTPNEAWELAASKGFVPHTVSDDEARPLFRPQVMRVIRRCEIEVFGNRYFSKYLEEFHQEQLRIGYDINDPAKVWVYDEDGRFICAAELDANKRDYMPRSVIEQARDNREAGRERRLEAKLEEVRAERRGAPALEQSEGVYLDGLIIDREELAARARAAVLVDVTKSVPPISRDAVPAIRDAMPPVADEAPTWAVPDTPQARWEEFQRMENKGEQQDSSEKQKKWRQTYKATAEYRMFERKSA
jgi:putative transposase